MLNSISLTSGGVLVWRAAKTGGFEMVRDEGRNG